MKHIFTILIMAMVLSHSQVTKINWLVTHDWRFRDLKAMGVQILDYKIYCFHGVMNVTYPQHNIYLPLLDHKERLMKCHSTK